MKTIALLILILFPYIGTDVKSSDCDYGLSPCEAYAVADAVFIGKVVRIVPATITQQQLEQGYDQTAYVEVEKIYKGYDGREIILKQLARKRAEKLINGASYIFYANYDRRGKHWEVRPCGRTHMADYAHDDLRYLDNLQKPDKRTRIAGQVMRVYIDPDMGKSIERVSGIKIKIVGEGKEYEMTTDEKGICEAYDIPPGKYSIYIEIPDGLKFLMALHYGAGIRSRVKSLEIELPERGCSGATIILETVKKQIAASGKHHTL